MAGPRPPLLPRTRVVLPLAHSVASPACPLGGSRLSRVIICARWARTSFSSRRSSSPRSDSRQRPL
eukprot:3222936-Alexandrium_andersonii.AAC.1